MKKAWKRFARFSNDSLDSAVKKPLKKFVTSFKPSYSVIFTMYHVIPGSPVQRKATRHDFGKGEFQEAKTFYEKVVNKTHEVKLAPTEVHLVKGKKKVVQRKHFGPVKEVKQMRMSA